jgi:SAM-dependent methyltransferase
MRKDLHQANRLSWNAATVAHNSHKGDQASYFRNGGSSLFPDERALLGDVAGLSIAHLQCNSGQDTLSLARLGARMTGVDISDEAVGFARRLSADSGIASEFIAADLYDWLDSTELRFDAAFSSYGTYCWLSDLAAWARGIARILVPNGRFVLIDFHPLAMIFDEKWRLHWPYSSGGEPIEPSQGGVQDYVKQSGPALAPWGFSGGVQDFVNPHPCHEFAWGLGDLVGAFLAAGFRVEQLREYPYSNGARLFENMRELPDRRFGVPEGLPELPLMFGLVVRK